MTILAIRSFRGEIPRLPADRLPEGGAQVATNCDFMHGELRPITALGPHFSCAVQPVRALFTDDGLRFFAWDKPTRAFLHPTIDDTIGRVLYQSHGTGLRVALASDMKPSGAAPRAPTESWKVGVKPPSSVSVARTVSAVADVYAQLLFDGAVSKETKLSSVDTVEVLAQYTAVVPAAAMDGTTAAEPLVPDSSGWITGNRDITFTYSLDGTTASDVLLAEQWKIDKKGNLINATTQASLGQALTIAYNGTTYNPGSKLFSALKSGDAAIEASVATLQFRVVVRNPANDRILFDGLASHVETEVAGTYSLTLPESAIGETQTVACVAVAVNDWGEESAPTDPVLFEWRDNGSEALVFSATYAADPEQRPVTGIVWYRTYSAFQSADYFLLDESPTPISNGTASRTDTSTAPATTTTLRSAEWDSPPAALGNLTYMGNGFFVGSSGKDLVMSEPYRPHAWPYRMTLPHGIVGIVAVEGGALVTTQAQTYLVGGAHPSQVSQTLLPVEQAGWSDTSIARVDGAAVYASNDGLVSVFGGQPSLQESQQLFTRKDWRERYSAARLNLRLAQHDGTVLGLIDPSWPITSDATPFIIRLDEGGDYVRFDPGQPIYGAFASGTTDQLLLGTATGFAEFAGSATGLEYVWQSGDVLYPKPLAFAAGTIDCTGDVTLEILADGAVIHTVAAGGYTPFRLPPAAPALRWSVRLTGTATVRAVCLGASFQELQQA